MIYWRENNLWYRKFSNKGVDIPIIVYIIQKYVLCSYMTVYEDSLFIGKLYIHILIKFPSLSANRFNARIGMV